MKKNILMLMAILLILSGCQTTSKKGNQSVEKDKTVNIKKEKVPGIETMREHGKKIDAEAVFDIINETVGKLGGAGISSAIFLEVMNSPNDEPVYIIESIEYNDRGLATKITGHVEKPATYREYVILGGLGTPVYEAVQPNEFGVIFGRSGNIAIRDGAVVKVNNLAQEEFYELLMGSEMYDEFTRVSLLSQVAMSVRVPYLKNYTIELEGMLLNSSSKKAILDGITEFKKDPKNKGKSNEEILISFMAGNKSYLKELKSSNKQTMKRIQKSRELLDLMQSAVTVQSINIAKIIGQIAQDTANMFLDPMSAPSYIANYIARNIPTNYSLSWSDLGNIQKYGSYRMKKADESFKANVEIDKMIFDINKEMLK